MRKNKPIKAGLLKDARGVAAIEFALLFLPFFIFFSILLEVIFVTYESVALEYANSRAAKYASSFSYKDGYEARYSEFLESKSKNVLFFTKGEVNSKLTFCKSVQEAIKGACTGSNDDNLLIIYELSYKLNPLFAFVWRDDRTITSRVMYYSQRHKGAKES